MAPPPVSSSRVGVVHVHSNYSHDGRDSLADLRSFAQRQGIGFVGLTDHAEDFDAGIFERFQHECTSLSDGSTRLIAGLEFRFAGFPGLHLLALGLSRWIEPTSPAEFMVMAPDASRLTIVAHPILPRYTVPREVLEGIDAIEVWNGVYNTRWLPDPRAIRLLHETQRVRPAVVGTAGLDQHDRRNDREIRVILEQEGDDPLAELKAGRFINRGRTMSFDPWIRWSRFRLGALSLARWSFDRLERGQERISRALKRAHSS